MTTDTGTFGRTGCDEHARPRAGERSAVAPAAAGPVTTRRRLLAAAGGGVAALTGCLGDGGGSAGAGPTDAGGDPSVEQVRAAVSEYRDVSAALRDGYRSTHRYVEGEAGAMGVHFVDDDVRGLDPLAPNVLVYDLTADGRYELVAVEWVVPADAVDARPSLLGQPFHGPHDPTGAGEQYDLHAWLFEENPEGTFASFNPAVSAPAYVADVEAAREAIGRYERPAAAADDGYEPHGGCVEGDAGGMGVHYVNPGVRGLDERRPQALLYDGEGADARLLGAEWVVPAGEADDRPSLFGQAFHGPHDPAGTGEQYDLHAWLYRINPAGLFAPFNPRVSC